MQRTPHFLVNTLALKRGGLVKAVRERANALAASGGIGQVKICVLAAQPRLELDVASLKRNGHLHPGVSAYSILRTLDPSTKDKRTPYKLDRGSRIVAHPAGSSGREFRYFRNGVYETFARFDGSGRLVVVDHFDEKRQRYRRDEMDETGSITRTLDYRPGSKIAIAQRWFGRDGKCYLTIWQDPGNPKWGTIFLHGKEPVTFPTMGGLYQHAFEQFLAREEAPAIVSEFRENLPNLPKENLDDIIASVRHPNLLKIMTAHSNHLQKPYVLGSGTSPNWTRAGEGLDAWDRLVLLTEAQRSDMAEQFGHEDIMRVIGQVAPPESAEHAPVDPHRIVIVARIHPKKRLDEAMRVFAKVVESQPQARLEIFGFGYKDAEESDLADLIDELGITESVHFMPFTNNPAEIYASALVTLLTSASEGFPLTLLESMSHGVPVAAYDANYGPRDVIEDGTNGFLVPFGEHETVAERILELMADPERRARMDKAARATLPRFSSEEFVQRWKDILEADPLPHRALGRGAGPLVKDVEGDRDGVLRFTCNGQMPDGLELFLVERSSGRVIAHAPHEDGLWTLTPQSVRADTLVDAYVGTDEESKKRVPFGEMKHKKTSGWLVYETKFGSLSLKRR